jgi:small subunit ribosomal protein S6
MRFYETVFVARQDLTPAQVEGLAQQYTNVIRQHGGEVTKTEFCGLRSLAYMIKKNKKGHYVLLNIHSKADAIAEIERQMAINEDILRYLTIRVKELDNTPSALMQQRSYLDDFKATEDFEDEVLSSNPNTEFSGSREQASFDSSSEVELDRV